MAKSRGGGKGGRAGLSKKTRYPAANWQLDQDYIDKLSEEDKNWLDQFNKEYYLSNSAKLHGQEQIRERWRIFKKNSKDAISRGALPDRPVPASDVQGAPNSMIEEAFRAATEDNATPEDAAIARIDARREAERLVQIKKPKTAPIGSTSLKN